MLKADSQRSFKNAAIVVEIHEFLSAKSYILSETYKKRIYIQNFCHGADDAAGYKLTMQLIWMFKSDNKRKLAQHFIRSLCFGAKNIFCTESN